MERAITRKNKLKRRDKIELKGRLKGFIMFLPNLVRLLGRLLKDRRVPAAEKALFIAAIVYVISPLDLIPDIFPFIGQVDDLYMVALSLTRLINRTDDAVVRQHWSGGGDIVSLVNSITSIAPAILPQRVSRVISARVELAPAAKLLRNVGSSREPVVVEVSEAMDTEGRTKAEVLSKAADPRR
jgi:uncharacterized membrane protein YkvA (DUF1232 family)